MKSSKSKRLSLNKKTIANLSFNQMRQIYAGQLDQQQKEPLPDTETCQTIELTCPITSTATYYTCEPWSCAPYHCKLPVQD